MGPGAVLHGTVVRRDTVVFRAAVRHRFPVRHRLPVGTDRARLRLRGSRGPAGPDRCRGHARSRGAALGGVRGNHTLPGVRVAPAERLRQPVRVRRRFRPPRLRDLRLQRCLRMDVALRRRRHLRVGQPREWKLPVGALQQQLQGRAGSLRRRRRHWLRGVAYRELDRGRPDPEEHRDRALPGDRLPGVRRRQAGDGGHLQQRRAPATGGPPRTRRVHHGGALGSLRTCGAAGATSRRRPAWARHTGEGQRGSVRRPRSKARCSC